MNLPEMGPCSVRIEEEDLWDFRLYFYDSTFPKVGLKLVTVINKPRSYQNNVSENIILKSSI